MKIFHLRWKTVTSVYYHGVAGKAGLQLEDFVKTSCLSLGQFVFRHANHKLHRGICVVFLIVIDESWCFVAALQHGLQHRLLIGLHMRRTKQLFKMHMHRDLNVLHMETS